MSKVLSFGSFDLQVRASSEAVSLTTQFKTFNFKNHVRQCWTEILSAVTCEGQCTVGLCSCVVASLNAGASEQVYTCCVRTVC